MADDDVNGDAPATGAPGPIEPTPDAADGSAGGSEHWEREAHRARAEAKRLRETRNAAMLERDQLRGRVDQQDRAEIERLVGDQLQNPADFWLTTQIADLRDPDTGELDSEKVSEKVDQILADRPHWRAQARPDFSSGVRRPIPQPKTIGQAFKNALGGH